MMGRKPTTGVQLLGVLSGGYINPADCQVFGVTCETEDSA